MPNITYNEKQFTVEKAGDKWDITYKLPNGSSALAAAGLFPGLSESEAAARALTLIKTVAVGAGPASIAALPDGTRLYVANAGCTDAVNLAGCSGTTVSVLDAVSLAVRKTITVGSTPVSLAADAASTKVVVANRDSNTISSIRTSDDTVINTNASGSPQPTFVVVSQ